MCVDKSFKRVGLDGCCSSRVRGKHGIEISCRVSMGEPKRAKDQPRTDFVLQQWTVQFQRQLGTSTEVAASASTVAERVAEELKQILGRKMDAKESKNPGTSRRNLRSICIYDGLVTNNVDQKKYRNEMGMIRYEVAPKRETKPGANVVLHKVQQAVHRGKCTRQHRQAFTQQGCAYCSSRLHIKAVPEKIELRVPWSKMRGYQACTKL
ncbi:hypothetical protein B0H13DRAFT_1900499 [Mycena leptocephala]|nr:hypothetical protein B0H13DRAFT_1900499 [Mycena leptocephala]